MKNKVEFLSKIIIENTRIDEIELSEEYILTIEINSLNGKETEDIIFLNDFSRKKVVIDGFFLDIKCVLDTTNIEKIGVAISKKLKIDFVEEWEFIFITKNKPCLFEQISIRTFSSQFKLNPKQENYKWSKK
ncbi:hypothetical protein AN286_05390 [Aliarcobacter cryaerophilus ATCC 43158]|uniref:Uncharacterized protein n=1 Tax=Aliarcobacter cryaerophilus ATCC 43158 TaxID=1032070 RepID=A0AAD0TWC4_9BACT|nr:hypothetical protein [Aliarcobacter cryaerophilus]AYJ79603.1 hypothetical protein ACRYA_0453 [Aliarcobacter cryaerophilus ATCC 43158]PRM95176.1 hypothetical protein CJ667_09110 [Aliarcobacter cryaerophilus]QCZ23848.1 hypothetical protein AN286_05390 [Aliarcobacter cryaerophilus ATCC 43158]